MAETRDLAGTANPLRIAAILLDEARLPAWRRRRRAWIAHYFPEARAEIDRLVAAGEHHPERDAEAEMIARHRTALDPRYRRGEWPPPAALLEAAE